MARSGTTVTWTEARTNRLPDWAAEGLAIALELDRRGMLEEIGDRLRIRRQGGYAGIDVFLFLLYFFASNPRCGVRPFWGRALAHAQALAAPAGRSQLASPASISRALDAVETEKLRPVAEWLLLDVPGVWDVLRDPSVLLYDARGDGWHVFDFDPTVTTLRHRALPQGEELPEARRRSEDTAAPGYSGRKRGDVQFRRATLQHAGSGVWMHARLCTGNGDGRAELGAATDVVVNACRRLGHPTSRALMRADGEFGWVPAYTIWRERGVPFLTRLTRPELFDRADVRRRLAEADWHFVRDDGSGPRRSAAELGIVTVPAGEDVLRDDGSAYAPVAVRVVVSRYERDGDAEHGRVVDGWQYELFAVDVPAEALPAADAVHAFFARAGQENRFAQEDRELGLDRIVSYHLPGQELAALVGLTIWNLRIARGFELAKPPSEAPPSRPYVSTKDVRPVPRADAVDAFEAEPDEPPPRDVVEASAKLASTLGEIDWPRWRGKNPGWIWRPDAGHLQCPEGRPVEPIHVRLKMNQQDRAQVILASKSAACAGCARRRECGLSDKTRRKTVGIVVERSLGARADRHLRTVRRLERGAAPKRPKPSSRRLHLARGEAPSPGPLAVRAPIFLPAEARKVFQEGARDLTLRVDVTMPSAPASTPRLHAASPERRQHRRRTWAEHLARYALPDAAKIDIRIEGRSSLRALMSSPSPDARAAG